MGTDVTGQRGVRRRMPLVIAMTLALVAGGLWGPSAASAAVGVPVTYMDHLYNSAKAPSADKPQSKLWFHDGSWWALMVEAGGTRVYIHELQGDHTWRNTGTLVDGRGESTGDALWSSSHNRLYVASRAPGVNLQINAFTYDPAGRTWATVPGHPVVVNSGGSSESATIDQDTTGRLWVTYTRASQVWVAHSDTSGGNWSAGFNPSVADTSIAFDDLSALIAFNGRVGVLYSDQTTGQVGAFRLAIHKDTDPPDVWSFDSFSFGPTFADDHINLKQLVGDSQGRIFAAIKTSNGDDPADPPSAPLVGVLTYTHGATDPWAFAQAGTVADDHTRPLIMIDEDNRELYFFATAPVTGGDIFYKKTPLSDIDFSNQPGRGTPFIDAAPVVNNASGAKHPVTAASGLVLLAVAHGKKQYVHAEMDLAGGGGGDITSPTVTTTSPASGATGVALAANVTATFSEDVQGVDDTTFTLRAGSTAVPATVTYAAASRTATLDPGASLSPDTQYTATLTGGTSGIRDTAGNSLTPNPVTWSFTTASSQIETPPKLIARTPAVDATGVALGVNVTATFSEKVQGVDTNSFTVTNKTTGVKVPAAITSNSAGTKWILNPSVSLAKDTRYTVTLTGGPAAIRDTANAPFATESWEFLTGPRPAVKSRTPAVNATAVSRTGNVTVTFTEPVQGVSETTFVLKTATGAAVSAVVRAGATNQWILDPSLTLAGNTKYTATVTTAVRDLAGNPLAADVVWSFTTGGT